VRRVLALLYDVHGNLAALDAVLADAREQGADAFLVGGDMTAFGGWPEETLARLRGLEHARFLRGNHERWAVEGDAVPDAPLARAGEAATHEALDAATIAELYALPLWQPVPGGEAWHGSPHSDVDGFLPEPAERDADLLLDRTPDLLVVGHTHLPLDREIVRRDGGRTRVVNPGSVGLPFDGDPRAAYALLHDDGAIEHRRVAYDAAAAAARQAERWGDAKWSSVVADTIRTGQPAPWPDTEPIPIVRPDQEERA
jgi:diadenosine tetraphosphatase ApaH/serine/threonine PP2A family protein phosphatase